MSLFIMMNDECGKTIWTKTEMRGPMKDNIRETQLTWFDHGMR